MEASSSAPAAGAAAAARNLDWGMICTWALGFALVLYLGLSGGGYDPLVHDQVGIALWWIGLAAVAVGAIPRARIGTVAWVAIGLLAAFVLWTALSLSWTESEERTFADLARVLAFLAAFGLAVFARGREGARVAVSAVAAAIVVIATVALLSRLHPAWFPAGQQTGEFLESGRERLSYPLNYWNAMAALIAIGMPLVLCVATTARHIALRALAAAALPALMLTALFTLSRGGSAAIFLAVAVFLVFTPDRLPKLLTLLVAAAGGAVLVAGAVGREALRHGLSTETAHQQGDEMLIWTILVCLVVGLVQLAISVGLERGKRPGWTRVSRRNSLIATGAVALVAVVALAAVNAPSRVSNAWDEFKLTDVPGKGTERLGKATGESRYQFWSSAVREMRSDPLTGTGSGTFEFWWTRDGDTGDIVRDSHSLYFQTLGELGIVGFALLLAFAATTLVAGGRRALRAGENRGPAIAAALAGTVALWATAIFDWMWQVPVLPVAMLLLAAVLVTDEPPDGAPRRVPFRPPFRIAFGALALIAIVLIAIPLASTSLVRQSQAEANAGNLEAALEDARSAQNAMPGAATPRLQQALLLEGAGDFDAAADAAAAATEREETNWRLWLIRSRIEAQRGNANAAIDFYDRARELNPTASQFRG